MSSSGTMAAGGSLRDLQDEATCSICLEYFKDPVTVDCEHNFCRSCITECWEGSDPNCPQCREPSEGRNLRPNRQLRNMVEIVRKMQQLTVKPQEGDLCEEHEEKLRLFCKDDQKPICVVCDRSKEHKGHSVVPIKEASEEYKVKLQDWLHPLKKEMEDILKSKVQEEEEYKTLRNKLETERQKIVAEFEALCRLLREQEQTLLRRLDEMDKNITMVENANITKLCHQMTALSALITEIEEKCKEPAGELLKAVRSTLSRCNNVKFRKPEKSLNIKLGEEKCVDNLKIQKPKDELKKYKVLVTLDPDTAHPRLVLSEGRRRVRDTFTAQTLLDNPRRFTAAPCVLGSEGFTSGRHYWELQLLQEGVWYVGVAAESVRRKELIRRSPAGKVWAVQRASNGRYLALTSPETHLSPRERPRKLGVYLDYEGGRLSLYSADSMEHLYTFTNASFTHRIFPFFWVWRSDLRLM